MEELIKSIYESPEKWDTRNYTFVCGRFSFWTGNGFAAFSPHELSFSMTFIQKVRAWQAYKWWCKNAPAEKLTERK